MQLILNQNILKVIKDKLNNLFSKFRNDLVYKDKNPNDYTTFYYTKPSNFGKTSLINFQQSMDK
jgi:hypothetical protein